MINFWTGKSVLVTGGAGFIGSFVSEILVSRGAKVSITSRGSSHNIHHIEKKIRIFRGDLTQQAFADSVVRGHDIVVNLASLKRNIKFHSEHPAEILRDNTLIALNILEACRKHRISNLVLVGTDIIDTKILENESSPHFGYAWSKFIAEIMAKTYVRQYGMNITTVRLQNVYGPRDNFDINEAQVIPALIARVRSGENPLKIAGDSSQKRAFIYVEDAASEIIKLCENPPGPAPLRIINVQSTSISDLAHNIIKIVGQPDLPIQFLAPQSPNKIIDEPDIGKVEVKRKLEDGLKLTLQWYDSQLKSE